MLQENEKFYREVTEIVAVCWMADFVIGKAGELRLRRENPKQPPGLALSAVTLIRINRIAI